MKKLLDNKIARTVLLVVRIILIILIISFLLMVCLQRFSNNKLAVFNIRIFTVVTGSMEPKYNIGDVLISVEVEPDKIKVGDTISYLGEKGNFADKIITHQVEKINKDEAGNIEYITKGINNDINDIYPVRQDQVYGKVVYKVWFLSLVYKVIGTTIGRFLFVVLPILYIVGSEMIDFLLEKEEERRSKQA